MVSKLPCTVVVPEGTPKVKCDAIEGYGAKLVFCTPTPTGECTELWMSVQKSTPRIKSSI